MINENNLTKHYQEIAQKLDELIPVKWDKIAMYAEETGDSRSVCIYYYTDGGTKLHHAGDIPEEWNVDESIYDSLEYDLGNANKELWLEFKKAEEATWEAFMFRLNSDWTFEAKFDYDIDEEAGQYERELRWEYNELGIIPDDEYEKDLLQTYLKSQGKSL